MISILETTIRIEAGAELMYDFKSVLCARACRLPDVGSAFFVLIQNSHSSYYVLKLSARKIRTCTRYRVLVWPRPQNLICFTLLQVSVNSMTARNSESCLLRSGIDGGTFDLYVYMNTQSAIQV